MTPFEELRLWMREGPSAERVTVGIAGLLVLALLSWALVPSGTPRSATVSSIAPPTSSTTIGAGQASPVQDGSAAGNETTGNGAAAASNGPASITNSSNAPSSAAGGGPSPTSPSPSRDTSLPSTGQSTATASPCGTPGSSDQGVTGAEIQIAIVVPNIQGDAGNGLVGLPPVDVERKMYQAVIDDVNKRGGVVCRRLAATYYEANPLDTAQQHQQCLSVVQARVFAAINSGLVAGERLCLPQNRIPQIDALMPQASELKQYYPYLFADQGRADVINRDYVLGANRLGFFSGLKKLGVTTQDCYPDLNTQLFALLEEIGISGNQISTYDYGCPTGLIPPNQQQQAVLQFKTSGVTHVMTTHTQSMNDLSKAAQQQDFHPKWAVPDYGDVATFDSPQFHPDPVNFDGALAITTSRYGEENSDLPDNAATERCNQIMIAAGQPVPKKSPVAYSGVACAEVWMLAMAMSQAPTLTRANLVQGLNKTGAYDAPYPDAPAVFDNPQTVTGGQYWRPVIYHGDCQCFKVHDPTFNPSL